MFFFRHSQTQALTPMLIFLSVAHHDTDTDSFLDDDNLWPVFPPFEALGPYHALTHYDPLAAILPLGPNNDGSRCSSHDAFAIPSYGLPRDPDPGSHRRSGKCVRRCLPRGRGSWVSRSYLRRSSAKKQCDVRRALPHGLADGSDVSLSLAVLGI